MPQTLNDVPQSGQTLGTTQPLIRNNFTTIDTAFQVDHVAYSTTGEGKHNKVTMPVQAGDPAHTVGEIILYNKLNPVTNVNTLYIRGATGGIVPATASTLFLQNGYTYMPSGQVLMYGKGTANANTTTLINFPINLGSNPFSITLTEQSSGSSTPAPTLTVGDFSGSPGVGFNVKNSGASTSFFWMAIGRG
jgi:hypothetical protein